MRVRAILVGLVLFGLTLSHAAAQSLGRPNVVVSIYNTTSADQPPTTASLASFAPGSTKMTKLAELAPDAIMDISPDGKRIAAIGGDPQDADQLAYGLIGQTLTVIPVESGHRVLWAAFSPNGRFLSYTTASLDSDNGEWLLGIVEIASGKKIEFSGNFNENTNSAQGFSGAADAVGWSADGKRLYLRVYMPFSASGGFDTLYSMDLSAVSFDKPGRYPFPAATPLLKPDQEIVNFAFSADGTKLAIMTVDASNPPQGFAGTEPPPNTVSIRDLTTNAEIMAFHSEKGQALEFPLTWTPDGQKVIFVGGSFKDSPTVVMPTMYIVDAASKQVATTQIIDDPQATLETAMACSTAVFYVSGKDDPNTGIHNATLYSLNLSDIKTHTKLASSSYINLLTCVP